VKRTRGLIDKTNWDAVYLILQDLHGIFVDVDLLNLIIEFINHNRKFITHIIINGDGIDFFPISKFVQHVPKNPRALELQYELDCFRDYIMKPLRNSFKELDIIYIKGNHCARLEKSLASNSKPFSTLRCLQLPELLGFDKYNIKYYPKLYEVGGAFNGIIYHGSSHALNASQVELRKHKCNVIAGHIHRNTFCEEIGFNKIIRAYHLGHLANKNDIDINCKYSEFMYWQQSFGILKNSNHDYMFERINCNEKGFIYNEKYYKR